MPPHTVFGAQRVKAHLFSKVPEATRETTVGEVLTKLRTEMWDSVHYVYVLDAERKLLGVASVKQVLQAADHAKIGDFMQPVKAHVTEHSDQEHVAIKAIHHDLKAVPVLERGTERFLGAVPAEKVLSILHEEHVEDFLRSAGIQRTLNITDIFHVGLFRLIRLRIGWLFVGLLGGMLATLVVQFFEHALERHLALAFFIPVLVYMADAVGTQSQTLFIRSLTIKHVSASRYFTREGSVGFLLGLLNAIVIFAFAYLVTWSAPIALTVALAMFLSILVATALALGITSLLVALKRDAALGSGPMATVIQDLLTLLIYFLVATVVLG